MLLTRAEAAELNDLDTRIAALEEELRVLRRERMRKRMSEARKAAWAEKDARANQPRQERRNGSIAEVPALSLGDLLATAVKAR